MTHLLLRALLVFSISVNALASISDELFTLKLRLTGEQGVRATDTLLREAVGIELQRLSGELQIEPAVLSYFTAHPQRWVQRFSFSPYRQEGVVMGQWLTLVFDRPKWLQAMVDQGVTYWPAFARPRLLLIGDWVLHGTQTPIDRKLIEKHPDVDLAYAAYLLGMRVQLPEPEDDLARRPVLTQEDVAYLAQHYGVDGVLRLYFEDRFVGGARHVQLYWESDVPGWEAAHETGSLEGREPVSVFRTLLLQRMQVWRQPFEQTLNETRQVEVTFNTPSAEKLITLLKRLRAETPLVSAAHLVAARPGEGRYVITWRGGWQMLEALLSRLPGVRLVSSSEASAQVRLEAAP